MPDDRAGFMWDPLNALIAAGWKGAKTVHVKLTARLENGLVQFDVDEETGRPVDVVTEFDTTDFRETFLRAIERAQAS